MGYIQDLAAIYEGHQGQAVDFGPNVRYSAIDVGPSASDKQPLPTTTPGGSQYSIGYNTGVPSIGGENEEQVSKQVDGSKLMNILNTEIQKAKMFGMDYAVMVLSEIKHQVKKGL